MERKDENKINELIIAFFDNDSEKLLKIIEILSKNKKNGFYEKGVCLVFRLLSRFPLLHTEEAIEEIVSKFFTLRPYRKKDHIAALMSSFSRCAVRFALTVMTCPEAPIIPCPVHLFPSVESRLNPESRPKILKQYEAYSWGATMNYQLGYNCSGEYINSPRKIFFQNETRFSDTTSVLNILCSKHNSFALTEKGELYTWGTEYDGKNFHVMPSRVEVNFSKDIDTSSISLMQSQFDKIQKKCPLAALGYIQKNEDGVSCDVSRTKGKGSFNSFSINSVYYPLRVSVAQIACSNLHSLFCTNTGHVYSWGHNEMGQLGYEIDRSSTKITYQTIPRIISILIKMDLYIVEVTCGEHHSCATTLDEKFYGWGSNAEGQIGEITKGTLFKIPEKILFPELYSFSKNDGIAKIYACEFYTAFKTKSKRVLITAVF